MPKKYKVTVDDLPYIDESDPFLPSLFNYISHYVIGLDPEKGIMMLSPTLEPISDEWYKFSIIFKPDK